MKLAAEVLPALERVAARGSPYLEALLGAVREELAAARGGPDLRPRFTRDST
jgi:hypothetical protein